MGLETATAIALTAAVIGTATSAVGSVMQQQAAQKAAKANAKLQDIEAQRERVKQVRTSRIARANIEQAGANAGAADSSSVIGGAQDATNQGNQNISFINLEQSAGRQISNAQNQQAQAGGIVDIGSGLQQIGGTVFNNRKELTDIFSGS